MKGFLRSFWPAALVLALLWLVWKWGFCRFYVGPDRMAVITAKVGAPLPPGQILAKKGQKGVQEDVLAEGRHFLNPVLFERQIVPAIVIPPRKVGIVTSKVGDQLSAGEFLAEQGQKGIWRKVLGPGKYRLNPVGYRVDVVDAVSIPIGYAGVVTSLSGSQAPEGEFARPRQKGVREDILQPGLYYINPREFSVNTLEIGINQVSLLGRRGGEVITKAQLATQNAAMDELQSNALRQQEQRRAEYFAKESVKMALGSSRRARAQAAAQQVQQAAQPSGQQAVQFQAAPQKGAPDSASATFVLDEFVGFPSKDGFEISLDMTVEFELPPKNVSWLYRSYGDLPAAVDKIIMPQILSVSRLKGSAYGARDFVVGEGREKFQDDLTETLASRLQEKRIVVHGALIRHVNVPMQILDPIQQASVAVEQDLTNKEKQNTARKMAELNTELSLIDQRREQVAQETEKLKAEIRAEQEKLVASTQAQTLKLVAEVEKQTAAVRAEKVMRLGQAEADVVRMVEGEKARGLQLKAKAFGDPASYNLWTLADRLNPDVRVNVLHAGDGTLWTDLEKARLGDLGGAATVGEKKK
jgi:hypothetical protein